MEIKKAEFITSAVKPDQYPGEDLPQIALAGKSNVGKSSLINCLANHFKLARISSQPGKTRLINFYLFNEVFYLVDLPGYGFARVSKQEQEKWGEMMQDYFSHVTEKVLIVQLVDIRHNPTDEDIQMMEWIGHYNFPAVVVATKADKLGKTRWRKQVDQIRSKLNLPPEVPVIPFSAQTRVGKEEVLMEFEKWIANE